jgi:hypothetical protein
MNMARLQAATVHKRQMLKRVIVIRDIARANNHGNIDISGAALSQIEVLATTLLDDYSEKESKNAKS